MTPKPKQTGLERRQARARDDLRAAYTSFTQVLASTRPQVDNSHLDTDEVIRGDSAYARAIVRAIRVGVFAKRRHAGKVTLSVRPPSADDPATREALDASLKWVDMSQPLGDRRGLRMARSGLERGVKDPMTEQELKIANVAFAAMKSGREDWAAEAQRIATSQGLIAKMSRQAFQKLLRRLQLS